MTRRFVLVLWLAAASAAGLPASAQTAPAAAPTAADPSRLTLEQIFASRTFAGERAGAQWQDGTHTAATERTEPGPTTSAGTSRRARPRPC